MHSETEAHLSDARRLREKRHHRTARMSREENAGGFSHSMCSTAAATNQERRAPSDISEETSQRHLRSDPRGRVDADHGGISVLRLVIVVSLLEKLPPEAIQGMPISASLWPQDDSRGAWLLPGGNAL